ncbi:acyl carrier protein [Phormidium tenue FACHB-886]|nr:acyl carrier protein [Phormidium tenue FACHB-886]
MENQSLQVMTSTSSEVSNIDIKNDIKNDSRDLPSAAEIQAWIVSYLAELLEIEPDDIDVTISFDQYGLDSAAAVGMTGDLEDWLGRKLDPTLLYDYPTVGSFSRHLAEELKGSA